MRHDGPSAPATPSVRRSMTLTVSPLRLSRTIRGPLRMRLPYDGCGLYSNDLRNTALPQRLPCAKGTRTYWWSKANEKPQSRIVDDASPNEAGKMKKRQASPAV